MWQQIFGSQELLKQSLTTLSQAGDAMFFTDEEKAKHTLALLEAYEPFKLVQRCIVLLFTVPYVSLQTLVILGCMHGLEWQPISEMINEAFGYPVLAAVGLYLTGGVLPKK